MVRIKGKSEFKGQTGKVRSVKENVVLVDIESGTKPKTIRVGRESVAEDVPTKGTGGAGAGRAGSDAYSMGTGMTPAWTYGRTPMHGGMTPMYGAATPMHGPNTPALHSGGGQTPAYAGAATPALYGGGGQTPRHEGAYTPRHQYHDG